MGREHRAEGIEPIHNGSCKLPIIVSAGLIFDSDIDLKLQTSNSVLG